MFFRKNKNKNIIEILNTIELFLNNEINSLPEFTFECKGEQKEIKNKLDNICRILNQKNDEELQIYGELMLVVEKIQNADFRNIK